MNDALPKDIRVFGFKLVADKFNAKSAASSRFYEYLVPYSLFMVEKGSISLVWPDSKLK